tara:strand:+ start:13315 stop:14682 length:1368 start_codon:yes stop_codon:yes gene_type:complete
VAYKPEFWIISTDTESAHYVENTLSHISGGSQIALLTHFQGYESIFDGETLSAAGLIFIILSDEMVDADKEAVSDLIRHLKTKSEGTAPLVVVLSSIEMVDYHQVIAEADEYLPLPLNTAHLEARLRALLRLNVMYHEFWCRSETNRRFGVEEQTVFDIQDAAVSKALCVSLPAGALPHWSEQVPDWLVIDTVGDVEDAVTMLRGGEYSCCLIVVNDGLLQEASEFAETIRKYPRLYSLPVLLMSGQEISVGTIEQVISSGVTDIFSMPEGEDLSLFSRLSFYIRQEKLRAKLQAFYKEDTKMSVCDSLTGLYNYGYFMDHTQALIERMDENNRPVSLCCFYLEGLEDINRNYGYAGGDYVLQQVGVLIGRLHRGEDTAARIGAGFFALLMPNTTEEQAKVVINRITSIIRHTELSYKEYGKIFPLVLRGVTAPLQANVGINQKIRELKDCLFKK